VKKLAMDIRRMDLSDIERIWDADLPGGERLVVII
jgi:hypothetical protein